MSSRLKRQSTSTHSQGFSDLISAKAVLKVALSLSVAAFFLWSAFRSTDLDKVLTILVNTDAVWILAGAAAVILATYPRALRWKILMAPVKTGISIRKLCSAILIGYAGNNLIPRAGEVAKIWAIDRNPKKLSGLVATVAVERLFDLITVLIMFAGVTFALRGHLATVFPWIEGAAVSATIVIGVGSVGLLLATFLGGRILDRVEEKTPRIAGNRYITLARSFLLGMEAIRTPGSYVGIVAWTLLLNTLYALATYLPFFAFGFDERYNLSFGDALAVLTIATIGIIIPTPGGAGTYHYFCSRALHGLYGVPLEEAVAFATVVHGTIYITFLLLGGPGLISLFWNKRDTPHEA
jgi:uncharacterized protein (TIRG00374 family)